MSQQPPDASASTADRFTVVCECNGPTANFYVDRAGVDGSRTREVLDLSQARQLFETLATTMREAELRAMEPKGKTS